MNPAAIAPEIDRLVWGVNGHARTLADPDVFVAAGLPATAFGTLNNLVPFLDDLTESFARRRYLYRPAGVVDDFIEAAVAAGCWRREGDRLVATELLRPVRAHLEAITHTAAHHFWDGHDATVITASEQARAVLEASPARYGLARAAVAAPEPADPLHRFHLRLAGLRLLRNEAHVEAWRAHDLDPGEVEVLTAAWAGTEIQSGASDLSGLVQRGLVADGGVTEAGLAARQDIEDKTNAGVAPAFSVIDQQAFFEALRGLPPGPDG